MTSTANWSESLTVLRHSEGEEIRGFPDKGIQESIERVLATIPPGKTYAAVAHATKDGVGLSFAARIGNDWTIAVPVYKPYKGEWRGEAIVRWSR